MDFGLLGLDSFVCSNSATPPPTNNGGFSLQTAANAAAEDNNSNKQKWSGGFGFLKHERAINEEELRDFIKVAKTCSNSTSSNILTDSHQQMLSFSSPNSHTSTLPYSYHHRNAGMNGVLSGVRGPFTASQWMELEHQALIYKYITANVPIPSYLLNPIRKAFESVGFSPFSGLRSNALGWGSAFHLGFSNTDPEPGRCRRTDGKKWRCSRDAVADQKYCERHMNRGRHRSRKPVEGQPGQSAPSVTTTPAAAKLTSSSAAGGATSGLGLSHQHQHHHHQLNISGLAPNINNSLKDNNKNAYEEERSSRSEFGLVCSDSLLNPLNRSSSLINGVDSSSSDNINGHSQTTSSHHPLIRQFIDDFPKNNHTERASTHLSISIPTDEMNQLRASPQRLSRDLEMGLGVGPPFERSQREANKWVPISWEPSMGGPLGEVLHNSASTSECKNGTKSLNFIDRWDNSPRLASSPTGVLQRGSFVSLSSSSGGSSPRGGGESGKILDGSGLFNGLIVGSVLTNPSL